VHAEKARMTIAKSASRFVVGMGVLVALGALEPHSYIIEPSFAATRVALVIGNSAYKDAPLKNPVNDATDIAAALRGLGFDVTLRTNASRADMKQALRGFGRSLTTNSVGLFYYAGHGVQLHGRNYLIPVDASVQSEAELEYESIDADLVLSYMEEAHNPINIVILDACRNNPFARSFRSVSRGLVQMQAGRGTFIAFATAPGSVAADGEGRNGIYTRYLLQSLQQPDTDIDKVFRRVSADVARVTGGEQVPWVSTSLTGNFSFRPAAPGGAPAAPAGVPSAVATELAFWDTIKDSRDPADFREYLKKYPNGRFAGLARNRLRTETANVEMPVIKSGDRWVFRMSDMVNNEQTVYEDRITKVSGNVLSITQTILSTTSSRSVGRRTDFTVESSTWSTRGNRWVEGDDMPVSFPLRVGKTWNYSFKNKSQKDNTVIVHDRRATVTGWEDARVAAGVFRALKIVHAGTWKPDGAADKEGGTEAQTFWYAPDLKRWIKREVIQRDRKGKLKQNRVIELVSAKLQP
jgi:Caspase domain